MSNKWFLIFLMAAPLLGQASGGGTAQGTAGQLQMASSTGGWFAASSCTDNGTTLTCTEPISAPSMTVGSTTPGALLLKAGTGSIPALTANSAGFAAPATGGTSYLFKPPATITAGILHAAAPGTVDGVNESALTSSAVNLAADVSGQLPLTNIANQAADTVAMNATGGSAAPTAVAMPTCTTGADLYNTSTHTWSCVSTGGAVYNLGAAYALSTTTPTVALTNGAVQTLTLSGNTTIAFTQPATYVGIVRLIITQAAGGNDTVTWTSVKWPSGIAPVMTATASSIDVYSCILDGTYTYCTAGQSFQ